MVRELCVASVNENQRERCLKYLWIWLLVVKKRFFFISSYLFGASQCVKDVQINSSIELSFLNIFSTKKCKKKNSAPVRG